MKKSKSGGTRIVVGVKFSRIIPRYWCSVGCLLTGLGFGLGFVGCAPTVNEQKGTTGVVEGAAPTRGVWSKKEDKDWLRQNKMCRKHQYFEYRICPSAKNRTNDSPAKTHETYFSISPFSADSARASRGGHVWRFAGQMDVESFRVGANAVSTVGFSSGEGYLRMTIETATSTVPSYVITPKREESRLSSDFPILKRAIRGHLTWLEVEKK